MGLVLNIAVGWISVVLNLCSETNKMCCCRLNWPLWCWLSQVLTLMREGHGFILTDIKFKYNQIHYLIAAGYQVVPGLNCFCAWNSKTRGMVISFYWGGGEIGGMQGCHWFCRLCVILLCPFWMLEYFMPPLPYKEEMPSDLYLASPTPHWHLNTDSPSPWSYCRLDRIVYSFMLEYIAYCMYTKH